ncbi:MAG TPA: GntR family transcriptional regulator [Erythrobacter sp.]|nr:GntR family transcriptional regulator [Erythrobacter sp.]
MNNATHQGIREAIRARIVAGEWDLGERIPGEVDLAQEYGCSRTTVNRALQTLADEGVIERKRKGGTRVRPLPLPQAQIRIPIIRQQVEAGGARYSHRIKYRQIETAPAHILNLLRLDEDYPTLHLQTRHLADGQPFAFEDRWVNLDTVPELEHADLDAISANEWLIRTVPFSRGEVSISASNADADLAQMLALDPGGALFTMERTTWHEDKSVTTMKLHYHSGYKLDFEI